MTEHPFIPYRPTRRAETDMLERARDYYDEMNTRRSVRHFSADPIPRELIEWAIKTAGTAPSGANRQPWHFAAVSDPSLKRQIRVAAENEEREGYEGGRMPPDWREAVAPIGTTWRKPYLETAPWIVILFAELYGVNPDGTRRKNYYVLESVGIACGLFISAIHHMGLCTLTHTPISMRFLGRMLTRPDNERPFVILPVGYPAPDAVVPDLRRKPLTEIASWRS